MVGEKSIDHMALGFGMFDFAQQEGKGTGRASTHLAESLVERRETWAKGGAARPVRRLASRGEMPKEEGVCVSVWAGGGEGVERRNKKEAGPVSKVETQRRGARVVPDGWVLSR